MCNESFDFPSNLWHSDTLKGIRYITRAIIKNVVPTHMVPIQWVPIDCPALDFNGPIYARSEGLVFFSGIAGNSSICLIAMMMGTVAVA